MNKHELKGRNFFFCQLLFVKKKRNLRFIGKDNMREKKAVIAVAFFYFFILEEDGIVKKKK